jgi:hypothetical protein
MGVIVIGTRARLLPRTSTSPISHQDNNVGDAREAKDTPKVATNTMSKA